MLNKASLLVLPLVAGVVLVGAWESGQGPLSGVASAGAHSARVFLASLFAVQQPRPTNSSGYRDDTFSMRSAARVLPLTGDMGLKPYYLPSRKHSGPLFLDLRSALFTVSNSRNNHPTPANRCDKGDLPVNNNPLSIFSAANVTIVGGLVRGSVPQDTDWRSTYCNSTAVQFRDSPNGVVDGIRIIRAWDGIRLGRGSANFMIKNSWLSEVRDDAVENDYLHSGRIEDSLIDGTLQGMAVRPNAKSKIGPSDGLVEISGSLFRLQEHRSADGRWSMGSLVKNDPRAPKIRLMNNVIALDADETKRWADSWQLTWGKLAGASNNLVLWLSDRPIPPGLNLPPEGFRLLKGREARAAWAGAKRNWLDCHPKVARLPGDASSNFARCRPATWGGYTS